jgi:2-polyprenyl-6-methoxyphenol hydroxylase-like FAD-dependent oxidoreductase
MTEPVESEPAPQLHETTCAIVGGGPAGLMLGLLLARQGVRVTVLESHPDFDRDFRGDTVHPATLEVLDQLGLADELLKIPHGEIHTMMFHSPAGPVTLMKAGLVQTKFPFVAMLPQAQFLDFVAAQAKKYPSFELILTANVQRLVEENGQVRGVRYRDHQNNWHEVRAILTVAADGRFSKIRQLAGIELIKTAPPMDVLWFRLPRRSDDPSEAAGYIGNGRLAILLNRSDQWQIGFVIPKGGYAELKASGIEVVRNAMTQLVPWLADRVGELKDWRAVSVLSVESSRAKCWHKPGLLLIGDAAHVMSPVGGVGINFAIQDAVEASNQLGPLLKQGAVPEEHLSQFQRSREWVTKLAQAAQGQIQKKVVAAALDTNRPFRVPLLLRVLPYLPLLRTLPVRLFLFGMKRVRVNE